MAEDADGSFIGTKLNVKYNMLAILLPDEPSTIVGALCVIFPLGRLSRTLWIKQRENAVTHEMQCQIIVIWIAVKEIHVIPKDS